MTRLPLLLNSVKSRAYSKRVLATQRANLVAYWPMNEASGTTMLDASGNALHGAYKASGEPLLAQAGITANEVAPLFDGTNDFANIYSSGLNSAMSGDEFGFACWAKVQASAVWTDNADRRVLLLYVDSGNNLALLKTTANVLRWQSKAGNGTQRNVDSATTATGWLHLAVIRSVAQNATLLYVNGVAPVGTLDNVATNAWTGALATTNAVLGANNSTTGQFPWKGQLAHAAIWRTPLTAGDIAVLSGAPGVVLCEGDSLTAGGGSTSSWPQQLSTAYTVRKTAVGGTTVVQMLSRFTTTNVSQVRAGVAKRIITIWGGTNDLNNGDSVATVYANLKSLWALARTWGFKVVATTMTPAQRYTGYNTDRASLNTLIKSDATLYDALADVGADATVGVDGAELSATYYQADHLHPTAAGDAIIAPIVAAAIATL